MSTLIGSDTDKGKVTTFFHPVKNILVRGTLVRPTMAGWWVVVDGEEDEVWHHIGGADLNWKFWMFQKLQGVVS